MFEGEFTGEWFLVDGEWQREIYDPTDLDPAQVVSSSTDVPLPSCPSGAGLASCSPGSPMPGSRMRP